jgi:hypothetical protein
MTEDGGEQPMWRLIGSSRTPLHMAVQEEEEEEGAMCPAVSGEKLALTENAG